MKKSTLLSRTLFMVIALMTFQISTVSAADYSVKFLRIKADQIGDHVLVRWITDSEFNNEYFTVQRSIDGASTWVDVGFVESEGTSPGAGNYELKDENPTPGEVHYRIRQTDFDGSYTYSFEISIEVEYFIEEEEDQVVQVFPNPADELVIIESDIFSETTTVQMTDISGKTIAINLDADDRKIAIRPQNKLTGLYLLMISNDQKTIVKKVKFN